MAEAAKDQSGDDNKAGGGDQSGDGAVNIGALPDVKVMAPRTKIDYATILGLSVAVGMIILSIIMGQSNAQFFNVPSFMIVVVGTIAATATSFTSYEFKKAGKLIGQSIFRKRYNPQMMCDALLSLAVISKKKGLLALSNYDEELSQYMFLQRAIQYVIDGYKPEDVEVVLDHEIEALKERHKRASQITQRASEVAPAMGLIGTLVGLVQMLADLENPETIGPSMAIALLTTFYGAIMGTVIMAPLSVKLEKSSKDEALIKTLVKTAAISIARQDNPRRLEMLLNAELPSHQQIEYFD